MLDALRAVMRGEDAGAWTRRDLGRDKTLFIVRVFGKHGRDVVVAPRAITLRAVDDPREHGYFSTAAPYVLAQVMRAVGIEKIEGPLVALVPGGPVWDRVRDEAEDQLVWVLPGERSVELRFRPVAGVVPERPTAITEADAPAMPEPSPRPGPRYLESPPPGRACAHCGTRATRHRMAGRDALVCAACGRSCERQ